MDQNPTLLDAAPLPFVSVAEGVAGGYNPTQRAAMLIGVFSTVRSDLSAINRTLVSNETKDGYLLTHEEAASASARLLRANTTMAALGKIFETAFPDGMNLTDMVDEVKAVASDASPEGILTKVEDAIGGLAHRNKSSTVSLKHQG